MQGSVDLVLQAFEAHQALAQGLGALCGHQRATGQIEQVVEAIGRYAQDAVMLLGGNLGLYRLHGFYGGRFLRVGGRGLWRRCILRAGGQESQQRGQPVDVGAFTEVAQRVGAAQQGVNVRGVEAHRAALGGYQQVFHHMGQGDRRIQTNNACGTFERVRCTHAGFQLGGVGRFTLQHQQARIHDLRLRLRFLVEQLQHRAVLVGIQAHGVTSGPTAVRCALSAADWLIGGSST